MSEQLPEQPPTPEERIQSRIEQRVAEQALHSAMMYAAIEGIGERRRYQQEAEQRREIAGLIKMAAEQAVSTYDPEFLQARLFTLKDEPVVAGWLIGYTAAAPRFAITRFGEGIAHHRRTPYYERLDLNQLDGYDLLDIKDLITRWVANAENQLESYGS